MKYRPKYKARGGFVFGGELSSIFWVKCMPSWQFAPKHFVFVFRLESYDFYCAFSHLLVFYLHFADFFPPKFWHFDQLPFFNAPIRTSPPPPSWTLTTPPLGFPTVSLLLQMLWTPSPASPFAPSPLLPPPPFVLTCCDNSHDLLRYEYTPSLQEPPFLPSCLQSLGKGSRFLWLEFHQLLNIFQNRHRLFLR